MQGVGAGVGTGAGAGTGVRASLIRAGAYPNCAVENCLELFRVPELDSRDRSVVVAVHVRHHFGDHIFQERVGRRSLLHVERRKLLRRRERTLRAPQPLAAVCARVGYR